MTRASRDVRLPRYQYRKAALTEASLERAPHRHLERWLAEAVSAKLTEPFAMALSTVRKDGRPASRIVLLRGLSVRGLTFFTNYESAKGKELQHQRYASALFFWPEMERQVRIEGRVTVSSRAESDRYFKARPRGSQLAAWASAQSSVISGRETLECAYENFAERFRDIAVPRPPQWGGYRLEPVSFEFWQGRADRLHDRLRFRKIRSRWKVERLAP